MQCIFWEINPISTFATGKDDPRTPCLLSVAGVELGHETPVLGAESLIGKRAHRRPQRGDAESSLTLQNHWKPTGKTIAFCSWVMPKRSSQHQSECSWHRHVSDGKAKPCQTHDRKGLAQVNRTDLDKGLAPVKAGRLTIMGKNSQRSSTLVTANK